jgi:HSP20 family protein
MESKKNESRLVGLEPSRFVSPFRDVMDRFFGENFITPLFDFPREMIKGVAFPKVDISESEKNITVIANIPGLDREHISVEVNGDMISISGKLEKEKKEGKETDRFYRYEREYGEFRREFALPSRVDKDAVQAVVKNGVLTITLPKTETDEKKKISIIEE